MSPTGKNHRLGDSEFNHRGGNVFSSARHISALKPSFEQVYFSFIQPFQLNVTLLINTLINLVKPAQTHPTLRADTTGTRYALIS